MKVRNLVDYPVQLGDGRMIGASGSKAGARGYGKKELTERDQKRFENGKLEVIKQLPDDAETTAETPKDGINLSDGANKKNGGKI